MKETINELLFRSGDFFMPPPIKNFLDLYILGNDNSLIYLNFWSIVHFISGIIVFIILKALNPKQNNQIRFFNLFLIHTIWELWQIIIGMTKWNTLRGFIDIIVDTIMFMIGAYISSLF